MKDYLNEILPRLKALRREIHQYPETALTEFETANRIRKYLGEYSSADFHTITNTGIIAEFDSGIPGEAVLLRADTDALPITEVNTFEHKSKYEGLSHKCGHDGHTVMMLGVADLLTEYPIKKGKVFLLFQPAEENGKGAEAVMKSDYFKDLEIDFVFALHNLPGFEENQIVLKENAFNANVKSMIIKMNGKTAHAAEPEKGHNPALLIADILKKSAELTHNIPEDDSFFLITPIHIEMGELAYGISAGAGELHLTIRSWDLDLFNKKVKELEQYISSQGILEGIACQISWTEEFYANMNDEKAVSIIRHAAKANEFSLFEMQHGFKWGEDFGLFTQKYKGAMFGLGAGKDCPALHNPDYDFPDEITAAGILQFYQIIQSFEKK